MLTRYLPVICAIALLCGCSRAIDAQQPRPSYHLTADSILKILLAPGASTSGEAARARSFSRKLLQSDDPQGTRLRELISARLGDIDDGLLMSQMLALLLEHATFHPDDRASALEILWPVLEGEDSYRRFLVIYALASAPEEMRSVAALRIATLILEEEDLDVQLNIVRGLLQLGPPGAIALDDLMRNNQLSEDLRKSIDFIRRGG